MILTAQKINFFVGVKEKMVLASVSKNAVRAVTQETHGFGLLSDPL